MSGVFLIKSNIPCSILEIKSSLPNITFLVFTSSKFSTLSPYLLNVSKSIKSFTCLLNLKPAGAVTSALGTIASPPTTASLPIIARTSFGVNWFNTFVATNGDNAPNESATFETTFLISNGLRPITSLNSSLVKICDNVASLKLGIIGSSCLIFNLPFTGAKILNICS